jgi:protein TonB
VLLRAAKKDAAFYRVSLQQVLQSGLSRLDGAGYFTLVESAYRRLDCKTLGLQEKTEAVGGVNQVGQSSELPGNTSRPMPTRIRVAGNVLAAAIITRVQAIYPEEARKDHISGTVRLRIIVGKDGRVMQIEGVSGHPLLQQAAIEAVRQWRYKTTMLKEQSVEVDSTVDMIFSLPPTPATSP